MPAGRLCLYYRRRGRSPVIMQGPWACEALPAQCTSEDPCDALTGTERARRGRRRRSTRTRRRRCALDARGALPEAERERLAEAVRARALALPELAAAGTVMLFASFRTELDTAPIAEWVLRAGKTPLPAAGPRPPAHGGVSRHRPRRRPGARASGTSRSRARGCPRSRRRRSTSCSCPGPRSTRRGAAAATAAASTTTTCRSRGRARRGSRSPSRCSWCRAICCEPHDLPVTAIVTERRVIRPG